MTRRAGLARLATWMAVVAILLNAFAPTLVRLADSAGGAPWLEVCSERGFVRAQGGDPTMPLSKPAKHCPACVPHGASFGAPPPAAPIIARPCSASIQRAALYAPARPHATWQARRSRGPPVA